MGGVPGIPEYACYFSDEAKIEAVVKALQREKAAR
jgi:hypothetical protein